MIVLICSVLLLFSCDSSNPSSNTSNNWEGKIDSLVAKYEALDIFSGIVLVAEQGDPVYDKAFGYANREEQQKNKLTTLFDIGSMNKTFTKIVIKQLAEEGKLKLDDKLTDYVSGFEDPLAVNITINHLLRHESGFGDYHSPGYFNRPIAERTIGGITAIAKSMPLEFPPGEEQMYSNTGYVLLGAVIEKVTKKSYHQNVTERIIEPLGLQHTFVENLERVKDRKAIGYYKTPFGELETNEGLIDLPNPDGGFLSTPLDVMKFYRSYYYDTLLLNEQTRAKDEELDYYFNELPAGKAPLMAGGYEGANTAMYQVISDDRSIIVFANMDEPVAEQLATGILYITRGQQAEDPQIPAVQNVRIAYEEKGIDYVKDNFKELIKNFHPTDPKAFILNRLGYAYLYEKKAPEKAIDLFLLNTKLFPYNPNVWDSLAEGYRMKGDKEKAIQYYQKVLEIDPEFPSAKEALEELNM